MVNYLMIMVGSFCLGLTVTYAMWAYVRPIFLRQDLFIIRDTLWDHARSMNRLSDPAYRAVRQTLNHFIHGGHVLSLGVLTVYMKGNVRPVHRPVSDDQAFEELLKRTEQKAFTRLWVYMARDRFPSFVIWLANVGGRKAAKKLFALWTESDAPAQLSHVAQLERVRVAA